MKVGLMIVLCLGLAMGYLSVVAHSWADGKHPSPAQVDQRAPASIEK